MKISTIILSILIIIIVYLMAVGVLVYGARTKNKITDFTTKYIPYPAVIINYKNFVTVSELSENLQSVKKFYENQDFSKVGLRVDFSTEDGKKRLKVNEREILNKMIEDKAIEILAKKNGIKITKEMVDQSVSRKMEEYSSSEETMEGNLGRLYGWTVADFKVKIVEPSLYKEELVKIFAAQQKDSNNQIRGKIEKAQEELAAKADFAEVARKYSDGSTAQEGGELGWYKKDQIIPALADKVFSLEVGKYSDIIESELGFHIAQLEEKKTENNEDLVRFRQIFVRKKDFASWLGDKMKDLKVWIPLKDYYWDKLSLSAEFKDQNLKDFEKNIRENSQGDASVIF